MWVELAEQTAPPQYPTYERCVAHVFVDTSGRVSRVTGVTGCSAAAAAVAEEWVRTWRWTPYGIDGTPIPFGTFAVVEMGPPLIDARRYRATWAAAAWPSEVETLDGYDEEAACEVAGTFGRDGWPIDARAYGCPASLAGPAEAAMRRSHVAWIGDHPDGPVTVIKTIDFAPASVRNQVRPTRPDDARRFRYTCRVRVQVDETGTPLRVDADACTDPWLSSATAALLQWRWHPARLEGRPLPSTIVVNVEFRRR
jgi:hypothetical protein